MSDTQIDEAVMAGKRGEETLAREARAERPAATKTPSATALATSKLQKTYGKRRVVDDVTLHVEQGEVVGLLGANGAGKTTTFYMIVGLERPDRGAVRLGERDITSCRCTCAPGSAWATCRRSRQSSAR